MDGQTARTGAALGRLDFLQRLALLWQARGTPPALTRLEYLRSLAHRSARIPEVAGPPESDLNLFRRLVIEHPEDLRKRLLDANVARRRALPSHQERALRALEVWPDLLSPISDLRYEPSHSRLLAFQMNGNRNPKLARHLLRSFLELAECPPERLELEELSAAVVSAEAYLSTGRLDIRIESIRLLVYVEVKVDAVEGPEQLARYRAALDGERQRTCILVFLTLPGAQGPHASLDCVHRTLEDLLLAWLPFANIDGEASGYLARYLKSIALILGRTGRGSFEQWTFAEQRSALELVSRVEPKSDS